MKKDKYNKKKIMLLVGILLLVFSPIAFSLAKYVIEKNETFSFNLKGIAFNSDGLVLSDINYSDSKETLLNPERGYYTHNAITIPNSSTISGTLLSNANSVISDMKQNDDTLALTVFYLTNYVDKNLSSDVVDALDEFCDVFRQNGYKLIVRFAYFGDDDTKSDPDDFNQIIDHIEQLQTFFETNQDVIHAVQLGFIGRWGEWHSSSYATKTYRVQVIDKMLEIMPKETQILVRTPRYYKEYFGDEYFDTKLGLTDDDKTRIGIYNDGFLSTITDYGTYETEDRTKELKWMDYLTRYTIFGGETIYDANYDGYYEVEDAIDNMEKTHTNFLNRMYHDYIINLWKKTNITSDIDSNYKDISAYNYFKNKLGYRYILDNVLVPSYSVKQGAYLHLSFGVNNVGFGNLVKQRNVELIIEKDGEYYVNETTIDPRTWYSSEVTQEQLVFKLPGNIKTGNWNIYLRLPDSNNTLLDNEKYYIKFANPDIWESKLNANYIGTFSVLENENNTDNGFYQVNVVDIEIEDETTLNTLYRKMVIDGTITTSIEWTDEDIFYDEDEDKVYLYSDEEYLYIYTKSDVTPDNVDVKVATTSASSSTKYNYVAQNSNLYYYDSGYGDKITSIEYAKDDCIEQKIPLNQLGITSVSDIKGIEIVYMSEWNPIKQFNFTLVDDSESNLTGMYVDGKITHDSEYTSDDLFYQKDTLTIYTKIVDEYLYFYAYDSALEGSDISKTSLFIGSNDTTKSATSSGYMLWYEDSVLGCSSSGDCNNTSTYSGYYAKRSIDEGAEFQIAIEALGITSIKDIRNLKVWWRSSSYKEIQSNKIVYEEKLYPSDIKGKTVAFAKKPSSWSSIYIYTYDNDGNNNASWPGVKMTKYVDGENDDVYAYVYDDDMTGNYAIFSNNGSSQTPKSGYDIFLIKNGQQKIWDGTTTDITGWTNYDGSVSSDKKVYFKFKIPSGYNQTKGCAHIYYSGGNLTGDWPGKDMNLKNGYWEYDFDDTNNYSGLKVILNNCKLSTKFQTAELVIKPGITVQNVDNKWKVLDDN